jgi:serine/threonine-protein kinase
MTDPLLGSVLCDRYQIEAVLGQGGMATVYKATQLSIRRAVAIKVIAGEMLQSAEVQKRFAREAELTARLTHPNTVRVFDSGITDQGCAYIVMEYLRGQTVAELLQQGGPLQTERALQIAIAVLQALDEAHGLGVAHRDVKAPNIFLAKVGAQEDVVKLLDFGIAKAFDGDGRTNLTRTGNVLGTCAYMAPEQFDGEAGPEADIYSVGVCLYIMLTGAPPFSGDSPSRLMYAHRRDPVPKLQLARLPGGLQSALERLMAKNPLDRPPDALRASLLLQDLVRGVPSRRYALPPERRWLQRRVHRFLVPVGLAVAAFVLWPARQPAPAVPQQGDVAPVADQLADVAPVADQPAAMAPVADQPAAVAPVADQPAAVAPKVQLRLDSSPAAAVRVDGRPAGETPASVTVDAGQEVHIAWARPGCAPMERTLRVAEDTALAVALDCPRPHKKKAAERPRVAPRVAPVTDPFAEIDLR